MAVFEVGFGAEEAFSLGHIPAAGTRTWNEFIGKTSGYSYIDARGDIAGARWGRSGADDDVNSMTELHCDGRMKPAADICAIWHAAGVRREQHTVFYCGTGWRASLAFFYAWLMAWERIGADNHYCDETFSESAVSSL